MRGYNERGEWVDEPITDAQRAIVAALGFEVPERWTPASWSCGAFALRGTSVVVRHLPCLPEVEAALRSAGFRWDLDLKEWVGQDRTKAQVEVLQALSYCSGRYHGDGGSSCPVRVGAYA